MDLLVGVVLLPLSWAAALFCFYERLNFILARFNETQATTGKYSYHHES